MTISTVDPAGLVDGGRYTHGALVEGAGRTLYISGQIPATRDGDVPDTFEAQCRLVWDNVFAVLAEAGMTPRNLVKVTTFLSDRAYRAENSEIGREVLAGHRPTLTVVITGIYEEEWLLEIEAIAAD